MSLMPYMPHDMGMVFAYFPYYVFDLGLIPLVASLVVIYLMVFRGKWESPEQAPLLGAQPDAVQNLFHESSESGIKDKIKLEEVAAEIRLKLNEAGIHNWTTEVATKDDGLFGLRVSGASKAGETDRALEIVREVVRDHGLEDEIKMEESI